MPMETATSGSTTVRFATVPSGGPSACARCTRQKPASPAAARAMRMPSSSTPAPYAAYRSVAARTSVEVLP